VSFLVGHVFVVRLSLPAADTSIRESLRDCARLAKLGFSFLLSLMILGVAYLAVRARVQATLGLVALGHFEAAWTISMAYLGAVMAAMGTDFYPRLTALIDKPADASTLVNEQTRVALWLCAPICIGVIGFAPIATTLLFSSAFAESARLLQLLVLGDILKVLGWPLQYVILAAGDGRRFIALHVVSVLLLVGTPFLFLADLGLKSVGLGYIGFYLAYLPLVYFWARKRIGFRWDRDILIGGAILLVCALATFAAASWSDEAGMIVGGVLMTGIGISSLRHLSHLAPRESLVGRMAASLGRFTPVRSHDD
jgi:PST family polysaccharide transporter